MPGTPFGFELAAALLPGPLRLEIGAALYLPTHAAPFPTRPALGGDFLLAYGSGAACWSFWVKPHVAVSPCLDVELGALQGTSTGVTSPGDGVALWAAAGAGGRLAVHPSRRSAITFGLDAVFPLNRPTFVVTGLGNIFQPDVVSARIAFGAEYRF